MRNKKLRKKRMKRTWKKNRCWVILLAMQAWIIPCILCEQEREVVYQLPAEIMETEEEIIRWKVEAETEEVIVEPLDAEITSTNISHEKELVSEAIISLGEFMLTAYCPCTSCTTDGDGITDSGTVATQGRTVAVDPTVIPYGTVLIINGHEYIAEDCGGKWIQGKEIDIFFNSHQEAKEFGIKYAEVFIKEEIWQ